MPTYVYQIMKEDGSEGDYFEVVQSMTEDALTKHPETGEPVRRVPQAPNIGGDYTDMREKNTLSDKNLDRLGFTKYVNQGGGTFEKTAGKGPRTIQRD